MIIHLSRHYILWCQIIESWFRSSFLLYLSVHSILNTSSLLCDCHMQWLGPWLTDSHFQQSVSAVCAHPASLLGRNVLSISPEVFVCGKSQSLFPFLSNIENANLRNVETVVCFGFDSFEPIKLYSTFFTVCKTSASIRIEILFDPNRLKFQSRCPSCIVIVDKKFYTCCPYLNTDDFPKPQITTHPETTVALRGNNVTLTCVASSSSDSPMTTAWRKDGEVLYDAEVQNYARYQEAELIYTTALHLLNVNFTEEGRYQCVVSNHFGSNYSNRAKLTVNGGYFLLFIREYHWWLVLCNLLLSLSYSSLPQCTLKSYTQTFNTVHPV